MNKNDSANTISTLITNGFHIEKVERLSPENSVLNIYRYDKLGAKVCYSILFSDDLEDDCVFKNHLLKIAKSYNSMPLIVSDNISLADIKSYTKKAFFDFFGGIINTGLILIPNLPDLLDELGHNGLPTGLMGTPDDLHETYVCECLQFMMESPTRRYGIERRFQSLPDGVVLGKGGFMILVDSKSYSDGFDFKADDIKRFASYIEDFNGRYSPYFGKIFTFVVISGHFNDSEKSIRNRSDELYKSCNCKLSCIQSKELGLFVQKIRTMPEIRGSILWKNLFSEFYIEEKHLDHEISRILKDKIH